MYFHKKLVSHFSTGNIALFGILIPLWMILGGCSSDNPIKISDTIVFYPEAFVDIEPVGDQLFVSRYQGKKFRDSALFLYDPYNNSYELLSADDADTLDYNENNGLLLFYGYGFGANTIISYDIESREFLPLTDGHFPNWYMDTEVFGYVTKNQIIFQDINEVEFGVIDFEQDEAIVGFALSPNGNYIAVGLINFSPREYTLWLLTLDGFSVIDQKVIYQGEFRSYPEKMTWTPDSKVIIFFDREQNNFIGYDIKNTCYSLPIFEDIVSTDEFQYLNGYIYWEKEYIYVTGKYGDQAGVYQLDGNDALTNWLEFDHCP